MKDNDIFVTKNGEEAIVREQKRKRRDRFILVNLRKPLKNEYFECVIEIS